MHEEYQNGMFFAFIKLCPPYLSPYHLNLMASNMFANYIPLKNIVPTHTLFRSH